MADNRNSIGRYRFIIILMVLGGLFILGNALRTMLPPRSHYWEEVDKRFTKENIPIPANRGDLLDCNGQLLVGSLPEYRLYMDFKVVDRDSLAQAKAQAWRDSAFEKDLDSIAIGLAKIFPDRDSKWFRKRLSDGKKRGGFAWRIYPGHASYIQYMKCKELPLLRESALKGGFNPEAIIQRKKPFGSLASRTLGLLYKDSDAAKCGLELSFDTILRGKPGISHRAKVRHSRLTFVDKEPENGHDLMTTIDINIQDVADRALRNKLHEVGAEVGVAIVMETHTGDVKAIVNLTRAGDGEYYEMKNSAVSDLWEPGSTFKTASILVGLDDGVIKKTDRIDTGKGIYMMHGRPMKDHNWRRGGYGELTVSGVLEYSSNIGVSRLIDQAYHDDPDRFVRGLNRIGVGIPLDLPFNGKGEPRVRHPKKQGRYWLNWSNTALPWMSIGYECMLPPISTLTFYNAIANGGRMVKPRFIKAEMKDGQIIKEFPTEVIKESICKPSSLADIQDILEKVVSQGLGKKAGNKGLFKVSGKTGTAQIASGSAGYHSGTTRYMVSFCGYFPSEAPKYSCLVCIVKTGLPASGGGQAGPVFSEISQYIMTKGMYRSTESAADTNSVFIPEVSKGDPILSRNLLHQLDLNEEGVEMAPEDTIAADKVPNVIGMGARDAVFALQEKGLRVKTAGIGRVVEQNIAPGSEVVKGKTITLTLKSN